MTEHLDLIAAMGDLERRLPSVPPDLSDRVMAEVSKIDPAPRCDLDHLHLKTANLDESRRFYERWFRFEGGTIVDKTLFVHNPFGFLLCLTPALEVEPLPEGVHFGFTLGSADAVRMLWEAMRSARVVVGDLHNVDGLASFHCTDPDGRIIELFWETPTHFEPSRT